MHNNKTFKEPVLTIIKDAVVLVIGVLSFALAVLIFVSLFFLVTSKTAKADNLLEEYLNGGSYKTSLKAHQAFFLHSKYTRLSNDSKKGDRVPKVRYEFFNIALGRYTACVPVVVRHSDGTVAQRLVLQ